MIDDVVAKGVTADEVERAKNRLIADAVYAQDSQATMARWYGAALTTGSTVEIGADLARPHPRGDRRRGQRRRQDLARQAALGDRLSGQGRRSERTSEREPARLRLLAGLAAVLIVASPRRSPPRATTVERVVSPGGIEAWLVHEPSLPLVAIELRVRRRRRRGPDRQAGRRLHGRRRCSTTAPANSTPRRSTSGSRTTPIELRFSVTQDYFSGSIRLLKDHQDESFDLLRLALNQPRFDADAIGRVREQILAGAAPRDHRSRQHRQPDLVAHRVSGPSLRPPERRLADTRFRPSPPTICGPMRDRC